MKVWLLRHGRTAYNREQRYQGLRDIPLSPEGEAELRQADFAPETVWVPRPADSGDFISVRPAGGSGGSEGNGLRRL